MKTSIYKEEQHGGRYAMIIVDDGDGLVELNEDEIIDLNIMTTRIAEDIKYRRDNEKKGIKQFGVVIK